MTEQSTKEYVAIIVYSEQYTEDSWKPVTKVLKCSPDTTIKQISEWYQKHIKHTLLEVKLIETETNTTI
jgi:hypothetical protein